MLKMVLTFLPLHFMKNNKIYIFVGVREYYDNCKKEDSR